MTAFSVYLSGTAKAYHIIKRITHTSTRGVAKQKNIITNKFNGALTLLTCIRVGSGSNLDFSFKVLYLDFTEKWLYNSLKLGKPFPLKLLN